PVVVVLEDTRTVPVLREEWTDVAGVVPVDPGADQDVFDVRIPVLDWLPAALRERGLRFLDESSRSLARPALIRPPLLLDEPAPGSNLRFARRLTTEPLWPYSLLEVARHVFADIPAPGPDHRRLDRRPMGSRA